MRRKILFISSWYPNKFEPTNGNFVQRHAEAAALLHDVEVLHAMGDFSQNELYIFDEKVINSIRTLIVYYKNTNNPLKNFRRRMQAYKKGFEKMQMPEIVHANILHNNILFALWLKRKYNIPFVVSEHWSIFLGVNRKKLTAPKLFIAKRIANHASRILPVSQNLAESLRDLGIKNHFEVIGNVVDTELFHIKTNSDESVFRFLHISSLVPIKNADKIIKTADRLRKKYSNFELHIGGDGDLSKIEEIINHFGATDYIKSFGRLSLNEVAEKMKHSDCFVLFSDYENLPCVLLESLSTGVPVISTNVGGISEFVNDSNGILIERTEEALLAAMEQVLTKKKTFQSKEILHQQIESRFSKKIIAQKFNQIYQEVLKK